MFTFFGRRKTLESLIERDRGEGIDLARADILPPEAALVISRPVRLFASAPVALKSPVTIGAKGVVFEGVVFAGRVTVEADASAEFDRCAFAAVFSDSMVELRGADVRVTLGHCKFLCAGGATAMLVSGQRSRLAVSDCEIQGWIVLDCPDAEARFSRCSFSRTDTLEVGLKAVEVQRLDLEDCTFAGAGSTPVLLSGRTNARLTNCHWSALHGEAIKATNGAELQMMSCRIQKSAGVFIAEGASARISGCEFDEIVGASLEVEGVGTGAVVENSKFFSGGAISVRHGAAVVVEGCDFFAERAVAAFGPATHVAVRRSARSRRPFAPETEIQRSSFQNSDVAGGAFDGATVSISETMEAAAVPAPDDPQEAANTFAAAFSRCSVRKSQTEVVARPEAGPFKDYSDFWNRGQVFPLVTYRSYVPRERPLVEILIPANEPKYDRLTALEAWRILQRLPAILVRELKLMDFISPDELWLHSKGSENSQILAEGIGDAIVLYRLEAGNGYASAAIHAAWSRLLWHASPEEASLFRLANRLDLETSLCEETPEFAWMSVGEMLLDQQPVIGALFGTFNCVRAAIWWHAVERSASGHADALNSQHCQFIRGIYETVFKPEAIRRLSSYADGDDETLKGPSIRLLATLDPEGGWAFRLLSMPASEVEADLPVADKFHRTLPSRLPKL